MVMYTYMYVSIKMHFKAGMLSHIYLTFAFGSNNSKYALG